MNGLGSVRNRRPPHGRGIENGLGNLRNLVNGRDHARRARRSRLFCRRVRLRLEVVIANDDRSRELVRVRIERIPLGFDMLGDEHGKRNTSLGAGSRLDHTVKRIDQHMRGSEMKRGINVRVGDGRALGEGGVTQTLGNGGRQEAVVLLCLISEPEEAEEHERAEDSSPSSGLEREAGDGVLVQQNLGKLEDARVSPVGISPGYPRSNVTPQDVSNDGPDGEGNGETEIDRGQSDKAPVTAVRQVGVGGDEIPELLSPLHERVNGETWV